MIEAAARSHEEGEPTPFIHLSSHGEGVRQPMRGGTVVLSRLGPGRSRLRALAPSVKYVLEGEEVYVIEGRTRRLRAGEFMLVEGGVEFEARMPACGSAIGLCVYLGVEDGGTAAASLPLGRGRAIAGSRIDPLAALLGHYARVIAERPALGPMLARRLVHEATVGVEDYLAGFAIRLERLRSVKRATRIETLQRVERARCFLHENAERAVSLEEVAGAAALSRFHLTRSFAEVFGVPPLAYHRRLRLEAAARLLKSDSGNATAVAERLGYGSLSAFTRAFRQNFGVPPGQARLVC